ncbi:MAG: tRNA pseudouridine(55) synthase TruB [Gammaproteobacteria bacterium]|tara:strand:+ start:15519 stop:16358 length:840 start_codon:yes stop_codon:yes gene_type:complete
MNGFFLVNKGYGDSSNFVVQEIKKTFSFEKAGHLGTLDPAAEGLLIIAINRATKFSNYFLNADKSYDVSVELGVSTNTDDATGEVIYESQNIPKKQKIIEEIQKFKGISMQKPPFFSALKHKGKPLYKYARKGNLIEKDPRKINIKNINNINVVSNICSFNISCSKGTYIRSIARDLGEKLGCGAHMKSLKRISQDNFSIEDSRSLSELKVRHIIPIEDAFQNLETLELSSNELKFFSNGRKLINRTELTNIYKIIDQNNTFIGIGEIYNKCLKHKQLV